MPAPKDINAYPVALFRAIEDVLVNGVYLTIPCKDVKEAKYLRLQFYGLRAAIKRSPEHPLRDQVMKLRFRYEPEGTALIIEHIEDAPDSVELDQRILNAMEAARRSKP